MPELSDDRLAAILASVADHLVVTTTSDPLTTDVSPPNGSAAAEVEVRPAPPNRWRARVLVAAAVLVVAGVVGTVVAPVREAVAGWLGIGSTEVVRVGVGEGDPGDLPYLGSDLEGVDRARAERRLGAPLPDTGGTELGAAPVLALPPEGGVVLAWDDGATTLWVRRTEQLPAEVISKLLTFDDRIERIDGVGEDAAIIEGAHVLVTPLRRLAADTVLAWVDGGYEYRLESDLDPEQMVDIARSLDT